jgi:hypothetical protein
MQDPWRSALAGHESGGALMSRQFVGVEFKAGGRPYSFHNDGDPLRVGDLVRVLVRGGREITATVAIIDDDEPPFETKPIIGLAEDSEAQSEHQKEQ